MEEKYNLLSLDGGGVRGLSSLLILQHLMRQIDRDKPPKPCEVFHLIGGTSTGGLIAIMLGRLHMSVDECIDAYLRLSARIFQNRGNGLVNIAKLGLNIPRFDAAELESAIKDVIAGCGYDEDVLLKDSPGAGCKVSVCAVRDENHGHAVLSSYPPTRGLRNLYDETKIWEACRATSAASTFFEPVTIGRFKERFVDGGLGANNPVQEVWLEAMELFSQGVERFEDRIGCFVSIGTGVPYNRQISANAVSLFKALAYISTDTEQTAARFERERRRLQRDHRYFRWNVNLPAMSEIGLEEEDRLHEIAAATGEYFGRTALNDEVSRCVDQLWNERLVGDSPSRRVRQLCGEFAQAKTKFTLAKKTIERFFRQHVTPQGASSQDRGDIEKAMKEVDAGIESFEELIQRLYQMQKDIQGSIEHVESQVASFRGIANEIESKKAELTKLLHEIEERTVELENMRDQLREGKERMAERSKEQKDNPRGVETTPPRQQGTAETVVGLAVLYVGWTVLKWGAEKAFGL